MIGIRLADGSFYPIFDETQKDRKRMVLSPANDNQQEVRIPFFRADDEGFSDPEFLGSVNLDHISPAARNDKNISILVAVNDNDELEVHARDEDGGDEHELILHTRAVNSLSENMFGGDDFAIDDPVGLPEPSEYIGDREDMEALHQQAAAHGGSLIDEDPYEWEGSGSVEHAESAKPGLKPPVLAALVVLAAMLTIAASFLFFTLVQSSDIPPIHSGTGNPGLNLSAILKGMLSFFI